MRNFWIGVGVLVVAAGCQTVRTTRGGAVGVDRPQSMLISANEINRAATQNYGQMLDAARKKGVLDRDALAVSRVQRVSQRLIAAAPFFRPDAAQWAWEVHVFSSKELNAWCMPGGKIGFYTGLIDRLNATDDEIAAVIGHEIAHALREHGRERASQAMATQLGIAVVSAAAGIGAGGQDMVNMVTDLTFNLPNSRLHETEADRIGVELAARAGYNPYGAVTLWEKMARASNGEPPQWLSTHPSSTTRLDDLRNYSARVMPIYESAKGR